MGASPYEVPCGLHHGNEALETVTRRDYQDDWINEIPSSSSSCNSLWGHEGPELEGYLPLPCHPGLSEPPARTNRQLHRKIDDCGSPHSAERNECPWKCCQCCEYCREDSIVSIGDSHGTSLPRGHNHCHYYPPAMDYLGDRMF